MAKGNIMAAASMALVLIFAAFPDVDGVCVLPSEIRKTYWVGYTPADEVLGMEFTTDHIIRKNFAQGTTLEDNNCLDILSSSPYILVLMSSVSDPMMLYCIEMAASANIILMRTLQPTSVFTAAGQCRDIFADDTTPFTVLAEYDETTSTFQTDLASCPGDLVVADYTLTYFETAGVEVCAQASNSKATISDADVMFYSCTASTTYYQPFRKTLMCMTTFRNNIVGASSDNSDVLIFSADFSGKTRFYCARYTIDYNEDSLHFSLPALDKAKCDCAVTSTASRAEVTDASLNAGFKYFVLHSNQCVGNPCIHGGTCTQEIGGYSCACVEGFTGMDCETDIDDCASQPCQNDGVCNDGIVEYDCLCKAGFIGDHCETALCGFPTAVQGEWAAGYDGAYTSYNALTLQEFKAILPGAPDDDYYCVADQTEGGVTYVSASMHPAGNHVCLQYTAITSGSETRFVLVKIGTPESRASPFTVAECKTALGASDPQLAYPVSAGNVQVTFENCPFMTGTYQATITESTGVSCDGDSDSITTADSSTTMMDINSCVAPEATFAKPWSTMLRCAGEIDANTVDPSNNVGDKILVLGFLDETTNGFSYYCARYMMGDSGYSISLPIDDPFSSPCHPGQNADGVSATESKIVISSDACSSNPCENGATCVEKFLDYECTCAPGFNGVKNCDNNINECASEPCLNDGNCTDLVNKFECDCQGGWSGTICDLESLECASMPCMNGGTCLERPNGYYCRCTEGFIWQHCEHENNCENRFCENDGTCEDDLEFATCTCAPGWKGDFCEVYDEATFVAASTKLDTPSIILICLFAVCGFAALLMVIIIVLCRRKN